MIEAQRLQDKRLAAIINDITSRAVREINEGLETHHNAGFSNEELLTASFNVALNVVGTISASIAYNTDEPVEDMLALIQQTLPERLKELYVSIVNTNRREMVNQHFN